MKKIARPEFLLVLLALLASGLLMSQALRKETTKQRTQVEEPQRVSSEGSLTAPDERVLLRGQLAEMHDYDQRLLATVYWSLSGVFLVVVVIAGLNWFANYRIYEREREFLREEVNLHAKMFQSELEQRFHKLSESVAATGQKQTDDLNRRLTVEIKQSVKAEAQRQQSEISSLRGQLSKALYEETAFRARFHESLSQAYEAFGLWLENLEHMQDVGWLWDAHHIGDVLQRLIAILKKGQPISYQFQNRLTKLLDAAPPVMSGEVELLRNLLNSAKKVS